MSKWYPSEYLDSTYSIDFEEMYARGFRGIMFDIDNTLVGHGAPQDERSLALFERLKGIGFKCAVVSNNKEPRVKSFAEPADLFYVYKAGKPGGKGYRAAAENMGLKPEETFCVGDQIFTDVWGANRAGLYNILVKPLGPETEIQIVLKRILEKPIIFFFCLKQKRKTKTETEVN